MALTVPTPFFGVNAPMVVPATQFRAESPINLCCGPVTFPDGTPLSTNNATEFGFALYRGGTAPTPEVWNGQSWVADTSPSPTQSLFPKDNTWQTILAAMGKKDAATGTDQFATAPSTGSPYYFAKCFFAGKDASQAVHVGASPASAPIQVFAAGSRQRAGLTIDPTPADSATKIEMFLTDSPPANKRTVTIQNGPSGISIQLAANGALLTLTESGAITLSPASGQFVTVEGTLVVQTGIVVGTIPLAVP